MEPTLRSGTDVLVQKLKGFAGKAKLCKGDVLWLTHPLHSDRQIIKRLSRISQEDRLYVLGDNPKESTDSRTFGAVPRSKVLGRVVARIPPEPERLN